MISAEGNLGKAQCGHRKPMYPGTERWTVKETQGVLVGKDRYRRGPWRGWQEPNKPLGLGNYNNTPLNVQRETPKKKMLFFFSVISIEWGRNRSKEITRRPWLLSRKEVRVPDPQMGAAQTEGSRRARGVSTVRQKGMDSDHPSHWHSLTAQPDCTLGGVTKDRGSWQ